MKNRFKSLYWLASLVWLIGQLSCIPQSDMRNIVVTEDVLYISGEIVRLSGRVVEMDGKVDEHGFHISTSKDFSSPITISLGPKENGLGRFIGEYNFLNVSTVYYYRSFANINGQEVIGDTKTFSSLIPTIESFKPTNGVAGNILTIEGRNFTLDSQVKINNIEVNVISVKDETKIEVMVPALLDDIEVSVTVVVQDTTMVFDMPFTYHFGRWELETYFQDNSQFYECMFFKDGDDFIFGLGKDSRVDLNYNIWKLDLNTYDWSNLNFPGNEGTRKPFNSNGYWGAGALKVREAGTNVNTPYFWRYSSGSFELKPFVPFLLYQTVGVHLNGELYVFGGEAFDHTPNKFVRHYNEAINSWSIVGDAPVEIASEYPYFTYNEEAYFFLPDNTIWRYSPLTNAWDIAGNFPNFIKPDGGAVVMNDKVYVGLFASGARIWEWNLLTDKWVEKVLFKGSSRDVNIGFFSHNNKVYFFRSKFDGGAFEPNPRMELWSLDPTQLQ